MYWFWSMFASLCLLPVGHWLLLHGLQYWSIVCSIEFIGADGLVMGLQCGEVGVSGLEIGVPFGVHGLRMQL